MITKYYTKKEIMEYLNISLPTLNRYMKQGLKYVKFGNNVRFKMRDITDFIKSQSK